MSTRHFIALNHAVVVVDDTLTMALNIDNGLKSS